MFLIQILLFLVSLGVMIVGVFKSIKMGSVNGYMKLVSFNPIPAGLGVLCFILALFIIPSFGQVPAGARGVVLRFGAVTGKVLGEGLFFVTPAVESVEIMDLQVHAEAAKATAASRDLQDVTTEVIVNYRLDPSHVAQTYQELRQSYGERVMVPAIQEAIKSATAQFDAEQLVVQRPKVKDMIEQLLRERLLQHGIILDGLSITEFSFSEDFSKAIEAKVTATQQALKAKNDLERVKMEADQRVAQATAEAEAIKIQASAINSQGGRDYVALKAIEKWNGTVPEWVGSGSAVPFIQMTPPERAK